MEDFTVYIRREGGGKDYTCTVGSIDSGGNGVDTPQPPKYQQGTILGYDIRRDTNVFGSSGANGTVYTGTRKTKVYQLKAANQLYKVDSCGDFALSRWARSSTSDSAQESTARGSTSATTGAKNSVAKSKV